MWRHLCKKALRWFPTQLRVHLFIGHDRDLILCHSRSPSCSTPSGRHPLCFGCPPAALCSSWPPCSDLLAPHTMLLLSFYPSSFILVSLPLWLSPRARFFRWRHRRCYQDGVGSSSRAMLLPLPLCTILRPLPVDSFLLHGCRRILDRFQPVATGPARLLVDCGLPVQVAPLYPRNLMEKGKSVAVELFVSLHHNSLHRVV
jgi:hypothetical protein